VSGRTSGEDLARVRMIIRGRVQGVFFRASAAEQGYTLGVRGFARNRADGAVEIVAEGTRRNLERLLKWAQAGPSRARIDEVRTEWDRATGEFSGFAIR
jgi:acylphosphatase